MSAKGGWKRVIIAIDHEVRRAIPRDARDHLVTEIAEGVFPANPGPMRAGFNFKNCNYCEYDRICPADRDRAWLRVEQAPALQPYIELGAPEPASAE